MKQWMTGWILLAALFLTTNPSVGADRSGPRLVLNGSTVSSEVRVFVRNKTHFINLPFLSKYLFIVSDWNPDRGDLFLKFGTLNIKMYENYTGYTVNGGKRSVKNAPFESGGQLWLPLEFILRLGFTVKKSTNAVLELNWSHNYLLTIIKTEYQNRPAFLLIGAEPMKIKDDLLTDPDRLLLTIPSVQAHFTLSDNLQFNQPPVQKIRWRQDKGSDMKLVFDLNRSLGYQLIPDPEQTNRLYLVFNYLIEGISFEAHDLEKKVGIITSAPSSYTAQTYMDPPRYVLDFHDATLATKTTSIDGDGVWVQGVRISQYNRHTVRVVLDLTKSNPCFVYPSRQNSQQIIIRPPQEITRIDWVESETGGTLLIESSGELVESLQKFPDSSFTLDLQNVTFSDKLGFPQINSAPLNELRCSMIGETTCRIETVLPDMIDYQYRFSPDRKKMAILFQEVPLFGKCVVLDAGHGGIDEGACGRQGSKEKEINYEVVMHLKKLLEEAGATVILTRQEDIFIGLYERAFLANSAQGDLFISIHTNNHPNLEVRGIEVFFAGDSKSSKILAQKVINRLSQATSFKALKIQSSDFAVVRETHMPGVLVELGYLSNYQEEAVIQTAEFKVKAARGLFEGIKDYFGPDFEPSDTFFNESEKSGT